MLVCNQEILNSVERGSTQEKNPSSRCDLNPQPSMFQMEESPAKWMYGPNEKDEHNFSFASFSSS